MAANKATSPQEEQLLALCQKGKRKLQAIRRKVTFRWGKSYFVSCDSALFLQLVIPSGPSASLF